MPDRYFQCRKSHFQISVSDRFNDNKVFLISGNYLSQKSAEYILEKLHEKACPIPENFVISRDKYIHLQLTKKFPHNSIKP